MGNATYNIRCVCTTLTQPKISPDSILLVLHDTDTILGKGYRYSHLGQCLVPGFGGQTVPTRLSYQTNPYWIVPARLSLPGCAGQTNLTV